MNEPAEKPAPCHACGQMTKGVLINNKRICPDCWKKFNLTKELGIDPFDLFGWGLKS